MLELLRNKPDMLLLAGLIFLTMWGMMRLKRRQREKSQSPVQQVLSPDERLERMKQERGMKGDLESLMVEIEELSKRVGTRLDLKIVQVERLIQDADQRIAELRRLQGEAGSSPRPQMPGPAGPSATTPPVSPPGMSPGTSPGTSPGMPPTTSSASRFASPPAEPEPADELSRNVYRLADAGNTSVEIAQTLREHVGKVELILALRKA